MKGIEQARYIVDSEDGSEGEKNKVLRVDWVWKRQLLGKDLYGMGDKSGANIQNNINFSRYWIISSMKQCAWLGNDGE